MLQSDARGGQRAHKQRVRVSPFGSDPERINESLGSG
jgi:hypothetical protein